MSIVRMNRCVKLIRPAVRFSAWGVAVLAMLAVPAPVRAAVEVNTTTQKETGFEDGNVSPFTVCTAQSPNYAQAATLNGVKCMKFFWTQAGYDGTRADRGAEACSTLTSYKEGWYGFSFYLPSGEYPTNKEAAIAQLFQNGSCNSWGALLIIRNEQLILQHRSYCGTPTEVVITNNIQRNAWKPVIIHFKASHLNAGVMEVWYAGQAGTEGSPTYSATGINFGFGTWSGDTLAAGNQLTWKFGQYCYDDTHYTTGETRTIYFDNVSQLSGNPSGAWNTVNPSK